MKPRSIQHASHQGTRRVLYVINDLGTGGAQRVVLDQASGLDREQFAPSVASLEIATDRSLESSFREAGIPVHPLRRPDEFPLAAWPRLGALIRRLRPDIVHTHLAAAGVIGRLEAHRSRVPCIISTLHNLSDWEELRTHPVRWLDRRTLSHAHVIVTVSDAVRSAFERLCPKLADRAITVYNGVAIESLAGTRNDRDSARNSLGYDPHDFVVGAIARFDRRKGLDTLIEAVAQAAPAAPDLRVLLIGDGPERPRLLLLAKSRGIRDRVRMIHHPTAMRPYLAAMDVYAAPSRTEGLGVAIIEAMAAGIPVLAARVGGIPEVVEHGACGLLLPPDRPSVWREALVHLAGHREELAPWAQAAPARARRFSLDASVQELDRVYRELTGEGSVVTKMAA